MKKVFILMSLVLCSSTILQAQGHSDNRNQGQQLQAPQKVQHSFHNDHPNAKDVNWQRNNNQWHASHVDPNNQMHVDTYYDNRGQRLDTHWQLDRKDVPNEVDQHLRDHYHANDNYQAFKIERPNQTEVFQLKIKDRGRDKVVYTDNHGHEMKYNDHH